MKVSGIRKTMDSVRRQTADAVARQTKTIQDSLVVKLAEATPIDTGFARESWKSENGKITNEADYILALNEGSSKQAPSHFIEQVILENPDVKLNGTLVRSV